MTEKDKHGWRDLRFVAPVVLCFAVPILAAVLLIPLAQRGEASAASAPVSAVVEVGSREADFRQAVGVEIKLNPAGVVKTNTTGRITAVHVSPGDPVTSGTKLIDVNGAPVFAMPQTPPLYRDLAVGTEGPDVAAVQAFLVAGGFLADSPDSTDGDFGYRTADAVCEFQEAAGVECTEVFSMFHVAFVPASITTVGTIEHVVGDTVNAAEPVLTGTPTPAAAVFAPAAENGDLRAYGDEPVVISTSAGADLILPRASPLDGAEVAALYEFVQAAVRSGDLAAPPAATNDDAGSGTSVSYTGLTLRKESASRVAVVPGNSVLAAPGGVNCVITVAGSEAGSTSAPPRYEAVRVRSVAPAVGQLGQVFTDAELVGSVVLRDPTTAPADVRSACG